MATVYLDRNETWIAANNVSRVYGQSAGNESVTLSAGVTGIELDGNVEEVGFSLSAGDTALRVNEATSRLEIRAAGNTLASFSSGLQGPTELAFSDGTAVVQQVGATRFELRSSRDSTNVLSVTTGPSQAGDAAGLGSGHDSDGGPDDAALPQTLTLGEAMAFDTPPSVYEIDPQVTYTPQQPLTIAAAESEYGDVEDLIAGASNQSALSLDTLFDWEIADRFANLSDAVSKPVLADAERHTLTDVDGADFGFLPDPSHEMVRDAENFTDYLFRPEMDGMEGRVWPDADVVSPVIVRIISTFADGSMAQGSGVLVGPNNVLTASHVIDDTEVERNWASDVTVTPAYQPGEAPLGRYEDQGRYAFEVSSVDGGLLPSETVRDMALIHLEEPIGYELGYMDITENFSGGEVMVSGYPGYLEGEQLNSIGTATLQNAYTDGGAVRSYWRYEEYSNGHAPGSSGGPLWTVEDGTPAVVGNVSTGSWAYDVSNDIDRLNQEIIASNSLIDTDWSLIA